jgi:hypothetical protein
MEIGFVIAQIVIKSWIEGDMNRDYNFNVVSITCKIDGIQKYCTGKCSGLIFRNTYYKISNLELKFYFQNYE